MCLISVVILISLGDYTPHVIQFNTKWQNIILSKLFPHESKIYLNILLAKQMVLCLCLYGSSHELSLEGSISHCLDRIKPCSTEKIFELVC